VHAITKLSPVVVNVVNPPVKVVTMLKATVSTVVNTPVAVPVVSDKSHRVYGYVSAETNLILLGSLPLAGVDTEVAGDALEIATHHVRSGLSAVL
jgi:hypothetical protein